MIIYLAMIFSVFEMLSVIFNQFFYDVNFYGFIFPINISVVFFCLGFFVLDITTEIYNNRTANNFIYGKIICQIIFVAFGQLGILGAGIENTQLAHIINETPLMIFNGMVASLVGYRLTTHIMQKLKVKYDGQFLMFRYIVSTLPGEIAFSLVFTFLSFSSGNTVDKTLVIFVSLSLVKIVLSVLFSIIVVPITRLIKYELGLTGMHKEFVPFN